MTGLVNVGSDGGGPGGGGGGGGAWFSSNAGVSKTRVRQLS
jgi:hypothetical protein